MKEGIHSAEDEVDGQSQICEIGEALLFQYVECLPAFESLLVSSVVTVLEAIHGVNPCTNHAACMDSQPSTSTRMHPIL